MADVRVRAAEVRYAGGFELRDAQQDGRYLFAQVTTYNNWVDVGPFEERMMPGVFDATLARHADDIKLMVEHEHRAVPVGTPVEWEKSDTGLFATWRFGSHEQARAAHTAAAEGMFSSVSVGFLPGKGKTDSVWEDGNTRVSRHRARLLEVSLVAVPANADARVLAVRTLGAPERLVTPRLAEARRVLEKPRPVW